MIAAGTALAALVPPWTLLSWIAVVVTLTGLALAAWRTRQLTRMDATYRDAIELFGQGLVVYDEHDRLLVCNEGYRRIYPDSRDGIRIGARFADMLRFDLDRGLYPEAAGREEAWLTDRLSARRNPSGPIEQRLADGRWVKIDECRMASGGIAGIHTDITALKQREAELADKTALLEATFQAVGDSICILDHDLRVLAWNDRYLELRQLPATLIRRGTPLMEILLFQARRGDLGPGDPAAAAEAQLARAYGTFPNRQRMVLHDGRIIDVRRYSVPAVGVVTIAADVSEQARAEAALRDEEARFRDFTEVSTDWVWELDARFRVTYISERVVETHHRSAADIMGRHLGELGAVANSPALLEAHREDLRARRPFRDFEYRLALPGGGWCWSAISGKPIFDHAGRFAGYRGVGRDITERKRAEQALRESRQRVALHMQQTPLGVVECDLDLKITAWNPAAERILGWRAEEMIGQSVLGAIVPADRQEQVRALYARLTGTQDSIRNTNENLRKDGRTITCDWYNSPLVDADGRVIGFASLMLDVTDRVEADKLLREAKNQAEQTSRAKSDFLATMSHELRTPLNAIIGFSELIAAETFGPITPRYVEYARDIHTSGNHLLDIINDILDLSKIEAGKLELSEDAVDIGRVADACIRLVEARAQQNGIALRRDIAPGLPALRADARAVKQILLNLMSNAIKFTPEGGRVTFTAGLAGDGGLQAIVADTGIGMKPEDVPRALEPFAQIESTLTRRFEGTGLGLPLCRRLAELHGGTLTLESELGRGTAVTVTFPASRTVASTTLRRLRA